MLGVGLLLTALAYLAAIPIPPGERAAARHALAWAGGIALIPLAFFLVASAERGSYLGHDLSASRASRFTG